MLEYVFAKSIAQHQQTVWWLLGHQCSSLGLWLTRTQLAFSFLWSLYYGAYTMRLIPPSYVYDFMWTVCVCICDW